MWITSNGNEIELTFLDINLNGNKSNKVSMILEDKYYSLIFYIIGKIDFKDRNQRKKKA